MPFLAPKGAIRCDVATRLSQRDLVERVTQAMTQDSLLRKAFASPDAWQPTAPPRDAIAAFVRVRNKRELRLEHTSPHGTQNSVAELAVGSDHPTSGFLVGVGDGVCPECQSSPVDGLQVGDDVEVDSD